MLMLSSRELVHCFKLNFICLIFEFGIIIFAILVCTLFSNVLLFVTYIIIDEKREYSSVGSANHGIR